MEQSAINMAPKRMIDVVPNADAAIHRGYQCSLAAHRSYQRAAYTLASVREARESMLAVRRAACVGGGMARRGRRS